MLKSNATLAKLFIVATPIGNRQDISSRALTTLADCYALVCEHPQHSKKLLHGFGIVKQKVFALTDYASDGKIDAILALCKEPGGVVYISDAGTPCISDPGCLLVARAHQQGVLVSSIPGPCAVISAIAMSGLHANPFVFHGFLPHKHGDRDRMFVRMRDAPGATHAMYESPHRLLQSLEHAQSVFGPDQMIFLVKEMTKVYERYWRMPLKDVIADVQCQTVRGEYVWVMQVHPTALHTSNIDIQKAIEAMMQLELSSKAMLKILHASTDVPKNTLYGLIHDRGKDAGT